MSTVQRRVTAIVLSALGALSLAALGGAGRAAAASPILAIAAQATAQEEVADAVALKDGRVLVTWNDITPGIDARIRGRLVNSAGTAAGAPFTLVSATRRGAETYHLIPYHYSALQGKNGNIYVTWSEQNTREDKTRIYIRRFDLNAKQVGTDVLVVGRADELLTGYLSSVQTGNGKIVVVFHVGDRLFARVFDPNLKPLTAAFPLTPAGKFASAFSAAPVSGAGLAVAYYSSTTTTPITPLTIEGVTASADLGKVTSRFPLARAADVGISFGDAALGLIPTANGFFLGWDHLQDVVGQYFSAAGTPGLKVRVPSTATCRESEPTFARLPSGHIAVLFDRWCGDDAIHQENIVTIAGTKVSARVLVGHAKLSFYSSIGDLAVYPTGNKVFAAWTEFKGGDSGVFGRAVSPP